LSSGRKVRKVDDLGLDAFGGERFSSFKRRGRRRSSRSRWSRAGPLRTVRALPMGTNEVIHLRHNEAAAIDQFVFEEHDRVFAADGRLEQALGIGGVIGRDRRSRPGTEAYHAAIVLAVLGADAAQPRRWGRGTRPGSASVRPTCSWSWPPS